MTDLREALRALADEAERTALAIEDDGAEPGWKLPHLRREILRARRALLAADESRDMQVGMQVDKPESAETPRVKKGFRIGVEAAAKWVEGQATAPHFTEQLRYTLVEAIRSLAEPRPTEEPAPAPRGSTAWRCGCGAWNSSPCWKCGAGPDARYASRAELDALSNNEEIHLSPICESLPQHTTCWDDANGEARYSSRASESEKE